jgi:hypothetical protein
MAKKISAKKSAPKKKSVSKSKSKPKKESQDLPIVPVLETTTLAAKLLGSISSFFKKK